MNVENGPDGQIKSVLKKLKTFLPESAELYSKKDFKNPGKILTDVDRLFHLRSVDYNGFIRETTSSFDTFSRTRNPKDVDPNHLLETLIVLSDKKQSKNFIKMDIDHTINSLLEKKQTLKSDPMYLILRALREEDSSWIKSHTKFTVERTQELLNRLLSSINVPEAKKAIEELFDKSLDLKSVNIIANKEVSPIMPGGLNVDMNRLQTEIKKRKENKKMQRFSDENIRSVTEDPKELDRLGFLKKISRSSDMTINKSGQIAAMPFALPHDYFENETNFVSIFGPKDHQSITTSAILGLMSKDQTSDLSWLFDCKNKREINHARKIVKTFSQTLHKITNDPQVQNSLIEAVNQPTDTSELNFSSLNKRLAGIIFEQFYYPQKRSFEDNLLAKFVDLPGIPSTIFALRKIFFVNLIQKEVKQNKSILKSENKYLQPNTYIDKDTIKELLKDDIEIAKFIDIPGNDLTNYLAYLTVEQYLRLSDNRHNFHDRHLTLTKDGEGYDTVPMPAKIIEGKSGIKIPISSVFNQEKTYSNLDIYYGENKIGQIPVK